MINILFTCPSEPEKHSGINYYRQVVPHYNLAVNNPSEFTVTRTDNINGLSDDQIKDFQIVQFSRIIEHNGTTPRTVERLKKHDIKIVFDIDDYWNLDKDHLMKKGLDEKYIANQTVEAIKLSDWVTTTTPLFADTISEFNKNVTVLHNAIDPNEQQFQAVDISHPRVTFGWIGGVYHRQDIELLKPNIEKLYSDRTISDKWQLALGGFNLNDEYLSIEELFTGDYKYLKHYPEYVQYLKQYQPFSEHLMSDMPYKRMWARDTYNYGYLYNDLDVCLIPLRDIKFNNHKSQIKVIEAGFKKKAVIVSGVYPYLYDCEHEINSLIVKPSRNHIDWFTSMRRLVNDPDLRLELADNLYEYVTAKYDINVVNKERIDLYKQLTT